MQHPFLDFLGSSLVPELSSDVAAGSSGYVHLILVRVAAVGALPDKLSMLILFDFNLAVLATDLTVIALGVKLGVHNVIVNKLHYRKHRVDIVLHIRNLDI